ncbi:MAG: PocR ligand-binding domain-containing protein [Desulfovibrionales bacterium]
MDNNKENITQSCIRLQKKLHGDENRFKRITEKLTDYFYTVFIQDGQACKTVHSPACITVTGYSAEEFDIDPYLWINMVLPEDRDRVREQARKTIQEKRAPESIEHRIMHKKGGIRWVKNTIVPSLDQKGDIVAYDGLINDITERKEMEQTLRESELRVRNKLATLMEPDGDIGTLDLEDIINIPEIQRLMDDFYDITNIGSAIVDIKGKVLVATGWQDICTKFHRVHPETYRNCLESDIHLSASSSPGEFSLYKCKNNLWDMSTPIIVGEKRLGNIFLGQFIFADEEPETELFRKQARRYGFDEKKYLEALQRVPRFTRETVNKAMTFYTRLANLVSDLSFGHIKLARAVNEKAKTEKELKVVNAQLEKALADKDKFFSIIAHDLRSPFIGFHNFIKLMDEHLDHMSQEDLRKLTEDMKANADNLYNLLNNLLEWARVQRGLTSYEPEEIHLSKILKNCREIIKPAAEQKAIDLHVSIPENSLVFVDKAMAGTIIRNIMANAVKFTPRRGQITVETENEPEMVKICIADNGLGMDENSLAKLFSQDQKFSSRGTEGEKGTGLGLLLCKEFIEMHGGEIWVDSKPGQGTAFYFTLPRTAAISKKL